MPDPIKRYGKSISVDLHNCNSSLFNRRDLRKFVKALCVEISMNPAKLVFWDFKYCPWLKHKAASHLKGTSLVQFIQTSSVTIHALDDLKAVYIDLFSCKEYDSNKVVEFSANYFNGEVVTLNEVVRI